MKKSTEEPRLTFSNHFGVFCHQSNTRRTAKHDDEVNFNGINGFICYSFCVDSTRGFRRCLRIYNSNPQISIMAVSMRPNSMKHFCVGARDETINVRPLREHLDGKNNLLSIHRKVYLGLDHPRNHSIDAHQLVAGVIRIKALTFELSAFPLFKKRIFYLRLASIPFFFVCQNPN